jgi:anti-sigma B factor antagonist
MNFNIENRDNFAIITILDSSVEGKAAAELKTRILGVAQPNIEALILDLTKVNTIDSSGLGALLLAHRQLKDHSIPVVLVGVQEFIKSLLNITRIEDIFTYFKTTDETLAKMERRLK